MDEAKQMTTAQAVGAASHTPGGFLSIAVRVGGKPVSSRSYSYLNEAASSFFMGALGVLEPDDGKLSSPVLRGLSGRKAARLPGSCAR
jgi:ferredoxin-NADP reductase